MENEALVELWSKVIEAMQEKAFPGRDEGLTEVRPEEMRKFIELSTTFSANIMGHCISSALKNITADKDKAAFIEHTLKELIQDITHFVNAPVKVITSSDNQSSSLKDSIN